MDFNKYKSVMRLQFDLLNGLYIDSVIENRDFIVYKSDTINDSFWNVLILNDEYFLKEKLSINDIENQFKLIDRRPTIYLPTIIDNYDYCRKLLIDNQFRLDDIGSLMISNGCSDGIINTNDIIKVKTIKQYNDFMEVMESAYGGEVTKENPYAGSITDEYYMAIRKSLDNNKFSHFVLYLDEKPASIATLSYDCGFGFINNVGTKKEYQNIGLGKQIMKHCLDEFNKLGGGNLYLYTEHDSKNEKWYEKIGYETIFINEQYIKS